VIRLISDSAVNACWNARAIH